MCQHKKPLISCSYICTITLCMQLFLLFIHSPGPLSHIYSEGYWYESLVSFLIERLISLILKTYRGARGTSYRGEGAGETPLKPPPASYGYIVMEQNFIKLDIVWSRISYSAACHFFSLFARSCTWYFYMAFSHGLFILMVFFHSHCLSNSTVKVMKGLPWQIDVAKDHVCMHAGHNHEKTMRKDIAYRDHEKRLCKKTIKKDHEKRPQEKTLRIN